jgi:hypothetical protein
MEAQLEPPSPDVTDPNARPTHHLEDVKVGDLGVQLLVSTKDHLYNAKRVEAGEQSWQVIGSWEEGSVHELGKILGQREANMNRNSESSGRFGSTYGSGQALGSSDGGRRRHIVVRQD